MGGFVALFSGFICSFTSLCMIMKSDLFLGFDNNTKQYIAIGLIGVGVLAIVITLWMTMLFESAPDQIQEKQIRMGVYFISVLVAAAGIGIQFYLRNKYNLWGFSIIDAKFTTQKESILLLVSMVCSSFGIFPLYALVGSLYGDYDHYVTVTKTSVIGDNNFFESKRSDPHLNRWALLIIAVLFVVPSYGFSLSYVSIGLFAISVVAMVLYEVLMFRKIEKNMAKKAEMQTMNKKSRSL